MRLLQLVFFFLSLLLSTFVCGQTANTVEGCFPLSVDFTAPVGYTTYFWDFDDGGTSAIENPTNVFLSAGTYTVSFRETQTGPVIGTVNINVYNKPVPSYFASATQGCVPLSVTYNNTTPINNGVFITNTTWVFTNGATLSGSFANTSFTTAGTFGLSMTITTNLPSCNNSAQFNNVVTVASDPVVSIGLAPDPAFSCTAPLDVDFQNNSSSAWGPLTYSWDLGNGVTSTATNPPSQTYQNGTYTATLTATDTIGCTSTNTRNISVGAPVASFRIDDTVCLYGIPNIINQSPGPSFFWTLDSGAFFLPGSTNTMPSPNIVYNTGGMHTLTLALGGPCPSDTSISFYVEDVDPTFTAAPLFSCSDPLTTQFTPTDLTGANYNWVFASNPIGTSSDVMPTFDFNVADTHTYTINGAVDFPTVLIITSQAGCKDTFVLNTTIHKPNALIYPSVTDGCVPLTVNFDESSTSASDIVNWEWHFGEGTVYSDTMSVDTSFTYTAVGSYYPYLIITNANGCIDTSYQVPIHVGDTINPSFSISNTSVCPGDSISFTDITVGPYADSIDTWHYYSDDSKLFSCFQEPNPIWAYTDSIGSHDVTMVVGYNGCYSETTITNAVTVNGPIAGIDYSIDCANPFVVDFSNESQDATTVMWQFGDGNSSSSSNPVHTYAATGDYTVLLIASNSATGCSPDTAEMVVHIRDLQAAFVVDSVLCVNVPFEIDASASVDVFGACQKGFAYSFLGIDQRPLMTDTNKRLLSFKGTGSVEIMLVVTDINNCTDTARNRANVYGVDADFSASDTTVCFPLNLSVTDLSSSDTTLVSWQWTFPSGVVSNLQNPTVLLDGTIINGNDSILLIVTDAAGCTSYDSLLFTIYDPVSTIDVSSTSFCTGGEANFQATDFTDYTGLDFVWDFGDGNSSTLQNPTNTYANVGTYTVQMTYTERGSGCGGTEQITVNVGESPIADFFSSVDTIEFLCPNENVIFTNTSVVGNGATFLWDFGNGSTSALQDAGTVFTQNGTYEIQLIAISQAPFSCSDTITSTITVQSPEGDFETNIGEDTICKFSFVTFTITDTVSVGQYYWDFGDGSGAGQISPVTNQYTFVPPSGQTFAKLIMSNPDGSCSVTKTLPINIYEVEADFLRNINDIDTAVCPQPFPFTNTSSNANTYLWDFGNGQASTSQNPPSQNFEPGTYDVTLSILNNQAACADTVTKTIIIFENPLAAIEDDTICEGETVQLQTAFTDPAYSYLWTSNPVFNVNSLTTSSVTDMPTEQTQYFLTVTDTNDCFALADATVEVFNPIIIADFDTIIVVGDSVFLPMPFEYGLFTYTWMPDTGLSCLQCPNPYIRPFTDVEYILSISDIYGCFTDEVVYRVSINPTTHIKLPTTFTPNGDGNNDIIYVEGWGIKELIEFKIFNRWGELVFETADKEVGWDGYYKGILQNNDVYLVQVKGLTWKDEEKTIEQYINLVR